MMGLRLSILLWEKRVCCYFRRPEISRKKFIFLEYYIIGKKVQDVNSTLEILKEKAAQGVEIKLLYVMTLAVWRLYFRRLYETLRSFGINAHKFNKVVPRTTVAYNNRDHRKVLVIDGQIIGRYQYG